MKQAYNSTLEQVFADIKEYLVLHKDYAMLTIVERLSLLISAMVMLTIALVIALIMFVYGLIVMHEMLVPVIGGVWSACVLIGSASMLFCIVYLLREHIIKRPVLRIVARILIPDRKEKQ